MDHHKFYGLLHMKFDKMEDLPTLGSFDIENGMF